MPEPVPQVIGLRHGALRAALRPDLGGCLAGLWWHDEPVLRSVDDPAALAQVRGSAVYPLAPYSNRIGGCRFRWQGQAYSTQPNFGSSPHSIHGVGWQRAWAVASASDDDAVLTCRHTPDADWPFALQLTQRITLRADGLAMRLACDSLDERVQPVGLGWHPFFPRRPGGRVSFAATRRWDPDATELPVCTTPVDGVDAEVAALNLDHCFDGWPGEAWVQDERFTLRLTSSCRRLVVFTPPQAAHFCVEPVSHVSNALQAADPLAQGIVALAPGARTEAHWTLQIDPNPNGTARTAITTP